MITAGAGGGGGGGAGGGCIHLSGGPIDLFTPNRAGGAGGAALLMASSWRRQINAANSSFHLLFFALVLTFPPSRMSKVTGLLLRCHMSLKGLCLVWSGAGPEGRAPLESPAPHTCLPSAAGSVQVQDLRLFFLLQPAKLRAGTANVSRLLAFKHRATQMKLVTADVTVWSR